jgi:hypothetical protein
MTYLNELSLYELGRLRILTVPLPLITRFNKAFELINFEQIQHMIPSLLIREFYPGDFLFVQTIPYLSDDECLNIYDLLAHLHTRGVHWCFQLNVEAPYLDDIFLSNPKFTISPTTVIVGDKPLNYLTITTY